MLTPYRGLFETLVIALFYPKIKIRVRGYSFAKHQIWRPIKKVHFDMQDGKTIKYSHFFLVSLRFLLARLGFFPILIFPKKPFPYERDFSYAMSSRNRHLILPKNQDIGADS